MDRKNKVILNLGDDSQSDYMQTRKLSRDHFKPGKFVCPQHVQALSLPAVKLAGKHGERQVRDAKHRAFATAV